MHSKIGHLQFRALETDLDIVRNCLYRIARGIRQARLELKIELILLERLPRLPLSLENSRAQFWICLILFRGRGLRNALP
jgi:hypothetical protein